MNRDEILAHLRERILAFAASRMGRDIAEDLAQDVLIVIEQKYTRSRSCQISCLSVFRSPVSRWQEPGVSPSDGESRARYP